MVNTFEITNYSYDLFLSSYDENGNFRFAFTIGFPDQISSNGSVAQPFDICINEQNNIIITGAYSGLKDFDPGSQVTLIPGSNKHQAPIEHLLPSIAIMAILFNYMGLKVLQGVLAIT